MAVFGLTHTWGGSKAIQMFGRSLEIWQSSCEKVFEIQYLLLKVTDISVSKDISLVYQHLGYLVQR